MRSVAYRYLRKMHNRMETKPACIYRKAACLPAQMSFISLL